MFFALPTTHAQKNMHKHLILFLFLSPLVIVPSAPSAAAQPESHIAAGASYADLADQVTGAPLVIKGRITKLKKVNGPASTTGTPPSNYLLVSTQVEALIRGEGGVAPVVTFLMQDSGRKDFPRKKQSVLVFAQPTGTPGAVQLVSRSAIRPWSAESEATVRAITAEVLKNDSPPAITGIGDAFHIAGTISGEGETQIFLKTATGAPVSLSIIRRPGQPPQWGVSLGEIVDEAAVPPARGTLLWYRLACGLPGSLPAESTRTLPLIDAEAARRDYAFVMESLGRCDRTL